MATTAELPLAPEKLRAFLRRGVRFLDCTWRKRVMQAYVRKFGPRGHIGQVKSSGSVDVEKVVVKVTNGASSGCKSQALVARVQPHDEWR